MLLAVAVASASVSSSASSIPEENNNILVHPVPFNKRRDILTAVIRRGRDREGEPFRLSDGLGNENFGNPRVTFILRTTVAVPMSPTDEPAIRRGEERDSSENDEQEHRLEGYREDREPTTTTTTSTTQESSSMEIRELIFFLCIFQFGSYHVLLNLGVGISARYLSKREGRK